MTRIWFVAPVFFDVPSFVILHQELHATLRESAVDAEAVRFVVLDDTAGRDPAMAQLTALGDVDVITPPFNLGHQRGLVFAVRTLRPRLEDEDVVVTLDADGEDRPVDVPRLLAALEDAPVTGGPIVLALRARRRHASVRFRAMYWVFRGLFRVLTGTTVRTGNFAAYRGWTAKRLLLHPSFDLCYSSTMLALDTPRVCVECDRGPRYDGVSRMGYTRLALHALRMLMPFAERIARRMMMTVLTVLSLVVVVALVAVGLTVPGDGTLPSWVGAMLIAAGAVGLVGLGNLIVLFTVFSQSRAVGLSHLEDVWTQSVPRA